MKEENNSVIPEEVLLNKIYYLRKEKVMLDKDLAVLYGVKAIRLREQVKRNIERFPEHFMFQLSKEETDIMVSQNAIASVKQLGGYLPYVFTEHGILMLANVLRSESAIKTSIRIIEIFVKLRKLSLDHGDFRNEIERIKRKVENQDKNIELVFSYLDELIESKKRMANKKPIGFRISKR